MKKKKRLKRKLTKERIDAINRKRALITGFSRDWEHPCMKVEDDGFGRGTMEQT